MRIPLGYSRITALGAPKGLAQGDLGGIPAGSTLALVTAETQGVRWRDDGTAPTATVGFPLAAGSQLEYNGDLNRIRFIQQTAGATLHIAFFKAG
jgi:hypothetical protein